MTIAWIAWRDPQRVLDWYDPYRAECLDWHYTEWRLGPDGPVLKGHFLNERQQATLVSLSLSEKYYIATGRKSAGPLGVGEAKAQLQRALQENSLQATGIQNNGAQRVVIWIAMADWARPQTYASQSILRNDSRRHIERHRYYVFTD